MKFILNTALGAHTSITLDGETIATIASGVWQGLAESAIIDALNTKGHSVYSHRGDCIAGDLSEIYGAKEI
jgi:hypothetical protein